MASPSRSKNGLFRPRRRQQLSHKHLSTLTLERCQGVLTSLNVRREGPAERFPLVKRDALTFRIRWDVRRQETYEIGTSDTQPCGSCVRLCRRDQL